MITITSTETAKITFKGTNVEITEVLLDIRDLLIKFAKRSKNGWND